MRKRPVHKAVVMEAYGEPLVPEAYFRSMCLVTGEVSELSAWVDTMSDIPAIDRCLSYYYLGSVCRGADHVHA